MAEYGNTNISAATDGYRSKNLHQRQSVGQSQPGAAQQGQGLGDTSERLERLERMPEAEMQNLVNQANLILEPRNLELVYRKHEATDRYFLTIYNRDTQEVAREIPPEWSLDMLARVWEMTGIFMNKQG